MTMDGDGEKEIEASQRESVGHFQSAERLVSLNFYCKVHYIMCIKICRWNIFGGVPALLATIGVPALLATIYMYIYIYICIYIYIYYYYIFIYYFYKCRNVREGGPPPQSGGMMGRWIDGWMMDRWMVGSIDRCMDGQIDRWLDRQVDGWMDRWIDG